MAGTFVADADRELFTPGHIVPAGRYVRVDAIPERVVVLDRAGRLPASLDGQVALYRRSPNQDLVVSVRSDDASRQISTSRTRRATA